MNDQALRELYRERQARARVVDRSGCAEPEALLALVEGRGEEGERLRTLDHTMACPSCRRDLELLRALSAARPAARTGVRWPLALAASLGVLVAGGAALWLVLGTEESGVLRGDEARVALVAPAHDAEVEGPPTLVWRGLEGASDYRVEVLDADGAPAVEEVVADTVLALGPDDTRLRAGEGYSWWVQALREDGTRVASDVRAFRIDDP